MKTIIKLSIQLSILLLSSCSSTSFINRKYTSGVFLQPNKSLKHNTISVDTSKRYASLNHTIELNKSVVSLTTNDEREIINTLTNSIIKKDTVFHLQRRGKDILFVKKCIGKHVLVVLNKEQQILKVKSLPSYNGIKSFKIVSLLNPQIALKKAELSSSLAFSLSLIPIIGLICSLIAFRKIKIAKLNNQESDFKKNKKLTISALAISLLSTLALIGLFIYFLYVILNSLASAFSVFIMI